MSVRNVLGPGKWYVEVIKAPDGQIVTRARGAGEQSPHHPRNRAVKNFLIEALETRSKMPEAERGWGRPHTAALNLANQILKAAEDKGITLALIYEDPEEFETDA